MDCVLAGNMPSQMAHNMDKAKEECPASCMVLRKMPGIYLDTVFERESLAGMRS